MIPPERSRELLLRYTADRCGAAFRELVEGWTGMVYATALRVVRGEAPLAEDVTQSVFSKLAAAPQKVKDPRALGAWLHAAATGTAMDALRTECRRRRREEESQLFMNRPEPTAAGAHELAPEIDGALQKLPAQDSQLLLMRYWQQQDWRSIGTTFGLSDDAAQKRLSRALDRLRRILARRGISSTTGTLTAVLAGTVPRDLPAAAVMKIVSAAQVHITAQTSSTLLTTLAMTTKTKFALASAALLIAAAAPAVYQQQRISALEDQVNALKQKPVISPPSLALAGNNKSMAMTQASDPVLPPAGTGLPRKMTGGPAMLFPGGQGLPGHSPELNAEKIKEKLAAMKKRLSLTPEQEEKIRGILEAAQPKVRTAADGSMMLKLGQDAGEKQKTAEAIAAVLNDEQKEGYSSFRQEETANAAEAVANRELSQLQSATTLSAEQKDAAFAALSKIALEEQSQSLPDPGSDPSVVEAAMAARWNARQEALSGILTPEQQAVYQQSGNPNRAVTFRMSPEGKAIVTEGKTVTK